LTDKTICAFVQNSCFRRISARRLLIYLAYSSLLFGQLTVYDSVRISVPFKEVFVVCWTSYATLKLNGRLKFKRNIFWVILSLLILLVSTSLWNSIKNSASIVSGTWYPLASLYMLLYFVGILSVLGANTRDMAAQVFSIGYSLFVINSYIAIVLFALFFAGLNPIMLGVNQSETFRAFGLMAEPSHFSIYAGMIFLVDLSIRRRSRKIFDGKIRPILLIIAFLLAQSPTGAFFVCLSLLLRLVANIRSVFSLLAVATFVLAIVSFSKVDIASVKRGNERIQSDFSVVSRLAQNSLTSDTEVSETSRIYRLYVVGSNLLNIDWKKLLLGYGTAGQAVTLQSPGLFYPGVLYLLVEVGIFGTLLLVLLWKRTFASAIRHFWWIIVPYIVVCLINSPGGIFGMQFLIPIVFLSSAGLVFERSLISKPAQ
jgi:hypothetical protein